MKIHLKRLICLLICIATVFSLASCEIVDYVSGWFEEEEEIFAMPSGYTGGLDYNREFHNGLVIVWFETYDEVIEVIEITKAYGTEINKFVYFDCEEYGIDVKYCAVFSRDEYCWNMQEGDSYFDRKIPGGLSISTYIFFDDISIEVLERSLYEWHHGARISGKYKNSIIDRDSVEIYVGSVYDSSSTRRVVYFVEWDGKPQFNFSVYPVYGEDLYYISDEHLEILEQTVGTANY